MEEEEDKNKKLKYKDKIIFKNIMKGREIYSNHLYKRIDNYDSNRNNNNQINHINQLLSSKEKDKNILLNNNKQKNIFLNNNINKYNHISRIINLKSLNGHNNNNNNLSNNISNNINNNISNNINNNISNNINNNISNNLNVVKDSFFTKYNKIGINQNNKQIKDPYKKEQKCISAFDSMLTNNNNSEELINNIQNVNMSILFNQKKNIKNNNANDDTPSVSTLAYSKKYNSNSINNQNLTEDHNNKFRMGLLSAFPNSNNNNIIIPIIPLQRPLSNFNLGCGQLWENIDNNKNNINKLEQNNKKSIDKNIINNVNILDKNRLTNNMRHKISTAPSQKRGEYNYFSNNDKDFHMINKNYSNIFNNINNLGPKLHHIKIDRSLMNNKLTDSLNKNIILNYMSLEQNQLPKLKNNHFNGIKKAHIIRNNSTKN